MAKKNSGRKSKNERLYLVVGIIGVSALVLAIISYLYALLPNTIY